MKTIKSNWQGMCPICNSYSINYGVVVFTDGQCYFPWTCTQCGQTGEEWFDMQFIGHNINFDDDCLEIEDYMVGTTLRTKREEEQKKILEELQVEYDKQKDKIAEDLKARYDYLVGEIDLSNVLDKYDDYNISWCAKDDKVDYVMIEDKREV